MKVGHDLRENKLKLNIRMPQIIQDNGLKDLKGVPKKLTSKVFSVQGVKKVEFKFKRKGLQGDQTKLCQESARIQGVKKVD